MSDDFNMQGAVARLQAAATAELATEAGVSVQNMDTDVAEGAGGGEPEAEPAKSEAKATPPRGPGGKFVGKSDAKPDKPAPAAAPDPVAKMEQLKELAKELGYSIDDARVSVAERAQFREQRRAHQQQIAQLEQAATARAQKILDDTNVKASIALKAQQAIDAGDFEGFAKALGRKDWNDLNREAISRFADPNYKRVQELEQWKREQEEARTKAEQERQRQEQEQAQMAQVQAYKQDLSATLAQSTDPLLQAFADDPMFINAVFNVQSEKFDPYTGTTVTPEEAVRIKPSRGGDPLFDELRKLYSRMQRAFQVSPESPETAKAVGRQEPHPEPAKAGSGRAAPVPVRQSKPSTSIPQRKATEAAAPMTPKSDRDFLKYAEKRLMEAMLSDE